MNGHAGNVRGDVRGYWILVCVFVAGWFVAAGFGFPPVMCDDLIYTGAPIHMAQGSHDVVNPWLGFLRPFHYYFFEYPPFYADLLAGWLKVFGVSTASLLFFQAFCAGTIIVAGALFLRRWGISVWALFPLTGLLVVYLSTRGFRPDGCAAALFIVGAWLESSAQRRPLVRLAGAALAIGSVGVLPLMLPWLGGLLIFRVLEAWRDPDRGAAFRAAAVRFALAAAVNGILFLIGIDFRLHDFIREFRWAAAYHEHDFIPYFVYGWKTAMVQVRVVLLPLLFIFGMGLFLVRDRLGYSEPVRKALRNGAIAAGCVLFLSLLLLFKSSSAIRLIGFDCAVGIVLMAGARRWSGTIGTAGWALLTLAVCGIFFVAHGVELIEWSLADPPRPENLAAVRAELAAERPTRILIDEYAARLLYDYRLPSNVMSANWDEHLYLGVKADPNLIPPGEKWIWIVSPRTMLYMALYGDPPHVRPVVFLGVGIPRTALNENELFILH